MKFRRVVFHLLTANDSSLFLCPLLWDTMPDPVWREINETYKNACDIRRKKNELQNLTPAFSLSLENQYRSIIMREASKVHRLLKNPYLNE